MSFMSLEQIRSAIRGRWLQRPGNVPRVDGVSIDTREDVWQRAFFAIRGDRFDGHDFLGEAAEQGAAALIVERSTSSPQLSAFEGAVIEVDVARRALGELARVWRRSLQVTRVVAITGSCGKTTTKHILHALLRQHLRGTCAPASFNNEIGVPLTILRARPTDAYLILEVGTNSPGEIARLADIAEPDIAIITMIGSAHLAGFGSIDAIAREKLSLLNSLREGGLAVVNADNPTLRRTHAGGEGQVLSFGTGAHADLQLTAFERIDDRFRFVVNGRHRYETRLPGRHNALNAIAAIAIARRLRVDEATINAALLHVEPPTHRFSLEQRDGIDFINDAYNANPESTAASISTFIELPARTHGRRVIVLGDMLELGEHASRCHEMVLTMSVELLRRLRCDLIVCVGPLFAQAASGMGGSSTQALCIVDQTDDAAMARVAGMLRDRDTVLLKGSRCIALERIPECVGSPGAESDVAEAEAVH